MNQTYFTLGFTKENYGYINLIYIFRNLENLN